MSIEHATMRALDEQFESSESYNWVDDYCAECSNAEYILTDEPSCLVTGKPISHLQGDCSPCEYYSAKRNGDETP